MATQAAAGVVLPYDTVTLLHLILTKKAIDRDEDGWFQATREELAGRLGTSTATVTSAVQKLVAAGWLQLRRPTPDARRAGQGTRYRLSFYLSGPMPADHALTASPAAEKSRSTSPPIAPPEPKRDTSASPSSLSTSQHPPELTTLELLAATQRMFDDPDFAGAVERLREGAEPSPTSEADLALARKLISMQSRATQTDIDSTESADQSRPAPTRRSAEPRRVLDALATSAATEASDPPEATEQGYGAVRLRTALKRIEAHADGNATWATRVFAEILWSSREGHLARCGRSAIDVGLKLVEEDRWCTPYGLSDEGLQKALKLADRVSFSQGQFSCH